MKWFQPGITVLVCSVFALALPSFSVSASDDLDVTMRMVTADDDLTGSIAREIRLNAPIGLEDNPGQANDVAREAREKGREFGQNAAALAKEAAQMQKEERPNFQPPKPESAPPERP